MAPDGLKVGDTIMAGPNADIKPGNALPFENIPVGTMIHNIELVLSARAASWSVPLALWRS